MEKPANSGGDSEAAHDAVAAAFRFAGTSLTASLEAARSLVEHHLTRGQALEEALRRVLKDHLPAKYEITTGLAVRSRRSSADPGPFVSLQQDLVLVDADSAGALWRSGTISILPIESIVGAIEVKTSVSVANVRAAVENVASVKRLVDLKVPTGVVPTPFGGVFAFDHSDKIDSILIAYGEACAAIPDPRHRSDALLILNSAIMIPGEVDAERAIPGFWQGGSDALGNQVVFKGTDQCTLLFVHYLLEHLRRYRVPALDLISYMSGAFDLEHQPFTPG
jgi:hypothetical protein